MISQNTKEIWKPIKDYELYYNISNLGRVKSFHRNKEKILKPSKSGEYLRVTLQKHGKSSTKNVHILVIQAFKEYISKYYVNHIDGNKKNNNINNLELCTLKENTKHAIKNKLFIPKTYRVSQYSIDKKTLLRIYDSVKDAIVTTGISGSSIFKNCKNKSTSAGSYFWKYTDFEYEPTPEPQGKILDNYTNYIITNDGNVYSKSHKKFMSKRLNNGYEYITLGSGKNKKDRKDFSVHYLVAKLYILNPNNYPMINHKNSIKTDNNINNLEWTTYSENVKQFALEKICVSVNKLDFQNNLIQTYNSIANAARDCNVARSSISLVLSKKRKTAGGFNWEYNKNKEIASPI